MPTRRLAFYGMPRNFIEWIQHFTGNIYIY